MKKSTVLFGTGEELMEQTRNPRLIEKRIKSSEAKAKRSSAKKQKARVTLPKSQTNNFSK